MKVLALVALLTTAILLTEGRPRCDYRFKRQQRRGTRLINRTKDFMRRLWNSRPGLSFTEESSSKISHEVCEDRENGNYQHPSTCEKYISCSNGIPHEMNCPSGLHYNHVRDQCLEPEKSNCLIYVGETTFGAKDRSFGKISLSKLPRGEITQIKLEHVSGYVTCHSGLKESKWGCNNEGTSYDESVIGTVITNKEDTLLFHQNKMSGYTGNSEYIVFNNYANEAKDVERVTTESFPDNEMRVWYKEDLDKYTTSDNSGSEKIKVYITVDSRDESRKTDSRKRTSALEDPKLKNVCKDRKNGNYQHPSTCEKYISCSNGIPHEMNCPSGLHYNHVRDQCLEPEKSNCLIYVGETTFGAKDRSFGKIYLSKLPRGEITQIKLEHVSGYVTCHSGLKESKWGCNNEGTSYDESVIGTVITNKEDTLIFHQNKMSGYTGNSEYIVFNDYANEAKDVERVTTESFPDNEMRVWYKEDLDKYTTSDNGGSEKIRVYVTVDSRDESRRTDSKKRTSALEDPKLENVCKDRKNGNYQHPSTCEKYIACANGIIYEMNCPAGLHYNHVRDQCLEPEKSNCLIYVGETTFGAKDRSFGKISLSKLPRGEITQIKLEHVSGYVTCTYGVKESKWGCNHNEESYNEMIIGTVITNKEDTLLFHQNKMSGYTGNSEYIVFNDYVNEAKDVERVTTESFPDNEMRVWYKEDLDKVTTSDNSGSERIKVYITVDSRDESKRSKAERTTSAEEDPTLVGVCKDREDGLYQHPSKCEHFISCVSHSPYVMDCPAGLHFNHAEEKCLEPEKSNCLIYVGETTFGAKDRSFGKISLSKLPRGEITQIKLEHVSGYVTCTYGVKESKWGCNHNEASYNEKIIGTVITNKEDTLMFHQNKMSGYTGNSEYIVFNDYANEAKDVERVTTESFPDNEMRVWYKEDLDKVTTSDNSGSEKIKVYVTVDAKEDMRKMETERTESSEEEPILKDVCKDRKNRLYQHPSRCDRYVVCATDMVRVMQCPEGFHYNQAMNKCVKPEESNCLIYVGETTFGAKDGSFGKVSLSKLPRGEITQIKLEHVSGFVTCTQNILKSKWGCNVDKKAIGTVITNKVNKVLFYQNKMPGFTGNSEYIVFNDYANEAKDVERVTTKSFPDDELRVWYKEVLDKFTTWDNSGSEKIKVYVTVIPKV